MIKTLFIGHLSDVVPAAASFEWDASKCRPCSQISSYGSDKWRTILPETKLNPGIPGSSKLVLPVTWHSLKNVDIWTHVRLNLYPDGGIARLKTFGIAIPEELTSTRMSKIICQLGVFGSLRTQMSGGNDEPMVDLIAMENGGMCVGYSDAHYGHPR